MAGRERNTAGAELLRALKQSGDVSLTIGTDGNVYIDDGTSKYPRLLCRL